MAKSVEFFQSAVLHPVYQFLFKLLGEYFGPSTKEHIMTLYFPSGVPPLPT